MKCGTCYHSCHHSVIFQSVRKVSSFTVAVMPYKFSKSSPLSQITSAQTSLLLFTMATTGDCNDLASWLYGGVFLCNLHKRFMNKNMKKTTTTLQLHQAHPDYWSSKKCFKCWYELSLHVPYDEKKLLKTTGISKGASSGNLDLGLERKTSSTGMIVLHPTGQGRRLLTFIQGWFWETGTLKRPQHCFSVSVFKCWNNNNCVNNGYFFSKLLASNGLKQTNK